MDTRCQPSPPERARACPRTCEEGVGRVRSARAAIVALLAGVLLTGAARAADVGDAVEERASDAIALCAAADAAPPETRVALLARGLAIAESAVALDERSARAHYAVVCNLGKATGLGGVGLGTWQAVRRLGREIDLTIALAPNDPEALAAKGAFLVKLPRWLGGDPVEAKRWLRRALAVDPTNTTARAYLEELGAPVPHVAPASDTVVQ